MKELINKALNTFGFELIKSKHLRNAEDMEDVFMEMYNQCKPYTMTSIERMYTLYKAVEYISINNIDGDFAECGVWKGGSSMIAAFALIHFKNTSKNLYLYDTFSGMSEPGVHDRDFRNDSADKVYKESIQDNGISAWCNASLNEVQNNLRRTGYPENQITYIEGKVEDTIPETVPNELSLLRLDTDWYDSTLHELIHLFPRLRKGGILILDDYGHWQGARRAADEYFKSKGIFPFLSRIDYTGRVFVKP